MTNSPLRNLTLGQKAKTVSSIYDHKEQLGRLLKKDELFAVTKVEIFKWQNYKHLDWITVRRDDDVLYKFKEGDFHRLRIQDIEDMLLLLVQGKACGRSSIGVESYQKKLTLTKPDTLMRIDELHKFSDGTLDDVRTALNDRLKGIRMEYLPQTFLTQRDKANARAMISAIDKRLKTRRIMRSLEIFVGGRPYGDPRIPARPEPEGSTQGYPLVSVEVLRFNTTAGNPVKKILLKLNLSDHMSILTDLKVTPTKPGRMTKPYSSPRFIANCFYAGYLKMVVEVPDSS
ncbi:hypothetical protein Tco_1164438 [Tanacetum coccineum]